MMGRQTGDQRTEGASVRRNRTSSVMLIPKSPAIIAMDEWPDVQPARILPT